MVVRRVGVVRVCAGSRARFLVIRREIALDGRALCIVLRPLAEAVPCAGGWRLAVLRVRPFSLHVRGGKARFDRDIRLPAPLRGLGLGTYLLSTLVRLAVRLGHAEARVRALHLVARDHTPLRAAFYRSMRFSLTLWADGTGWARAARLGDLRAACDPAKVRDLSQRGVAALLGCAAVAPDGQPAPPLQPRKRGARASIPEA